MKYFDVISYFQDSIGPQMTSRVLVDSDTNIGVSDELFCLVNSDQLEFVKDEDFDLKLKKLKELISEASSGEYIKIQMLELMVTILNESDSAENFKNDVKVPYRNNNDINIKTYNGINVAVLSAVEGFDWDSSLLLTTTEFKLVKLNSCNINNRSVLEYDIYKESFNKTLKKLESLLIQIEQERKLLINFVELFEAINNSEQRISK